jgi:hypothetical protein
MPERKAGWQHVQDALPKAVQRLQEELRKLEGHPARGATSAVVRLEAQIPGSFSALQWLMAQPQNRVNSGEQRQSDASPAAVSVYFSPRHSPYPAADPLGRMPRTAVAGVIALPLDLLILVKSGYMQKYGNAPVIYTQ